MFNIADYLSDKFAPKIKSYSDGEAPVSTKTFCAKGGRLCSVISYNGMVEQPVSGVYRNNLKKLEGYLSPYMDKPEHDLHFLYDLEKSPEIIRDRMSNMFQPNYDSMKSTGLDLRDLIDAKCDLISDTFVLMDIYFVIWTQPYAFSSSEFVEVYPGVDKTSGYKFSDSLLGKHESMVRAVEIAFNRSGFQCTTINVQQAIKKVRGSFNKDETPANYLPRVYPSHVKAVKPNEKINKKRCGDLLLPPPLNETFSPGKVEILGFNELIVGTRAYSTFDIKTFPLAEQDFDSLCYSLVGSKAPVRISVRMSGGGPKLKSIHIKSLFRYISKCKARNSLANMEKYVKNGGVVVGLQATICTWVDLTDDLDDALLIKQLRRNQKSLINAIQGWGSTEVDTKGYNALEQFTNSIPGFRFNNTSYLSAPPIRDAVKLLPLFKMATIWDESVDQVFKTILHQPIPHKRFSSEQLFNSTLIVGKPGTGKSVFINDNILSLACHPGLITLPFISVIDIKPSSFGAMTMIQDALPDDKKHLVIMSKIRNTLDTCINPNDTYYGARFPTPDQKNFQVDFWSLVTQNIESKTQSEQITQFIDFLITETFKRLADGDDAEKPLKYKKFQDPDIDKWVNDVNYEIEGDTTYWELFDYFHKNQEYLKAAHIQKFAMPTIQDLLASLRSTVILSEFEGRKVEDGSEIIDYIRGQLTYYQEKFPGFSSHTRLSFSQAKFISLDLQPVAGNSTIKKAHQTSIFYMLAQEFLTRNFLYDEDMLDYINEDYHAYHKRNIRAIKNTPKALILDEFHMTSMPGEKEQHVFSKIIQNSIESLIRVRIRVENIEVAIASQNPVDFSGALKDLYSSAFILGNGDEAAEVLQEVFGLSDEMKKVIPELGNPGPQGSSFIMINNTKKGNFKHILLNPIPPIQLWGTSTTNEDKRIRDYLYKRIDPINARKLLSEYFPGGSAQKFCEKMAKHRNVDITENFQSITDTLAENILNKRELHYTD